jgi:hypothetical protein
MPKFKPGHSGNPKGRPKGALGRYSVLREALCDDLPDLFDVTKAYAMSGDMRAMKLLLERVAPVTRPDETAVCIPGLEKAVSFSDQVSVITRAIANGMIAPQVGNQLLVTLTDAYRAAQSDGLASRIADVERRLEQWHQRNHSVNSL